MSHRTAMAIDACRWLACAFIAVSALLVASCGEDQQSTTPCPEYAVGAVEGFVRVAGAGGTRVVQAGEYPGDWYDVRFQTVSDSTGWYRLDLPSGLYQIAALPLDSERVEMPVLVSAAVRIDRGVQRLDLFGGRLSVRIAVPAALEDRHFIFILDPDAPHRPYPSIEATAEEGDLSFEYPVVALGKHRLALRYGTTTCWLPGSFDAEAADLIDVRADSVSQYACTLDHYASIAGEVHGSWESGDGMRPTIRAVGADSFLVAEAGVSDDGTFLLDLFIAQPVKLCSDGWGVRQWFGGESYSEATVFDMRTGDAVSGVTLIESGLLCDFDGEEGPANSEFEVRVRDEIGHETMLETTRRPVQISNLRPGRYFLHVGGVPDEASWAGQWYDRADSLTGGSPIDLSPGELRHITVHLEQEGVIEGRVIMPSPPLAAFVGVEIHERDGPLLHAMWIGGTDGRFSFHGLGNSDYRLAIRVGDLLWWYPGTSDFSAAAVIPVRHHSTTSGIEWGLPHR